VAFVSDESLKTLPLEGGPAFTVVPEGVPAGGGVSWGEDGMLYFSMDGLNRVPAVGGLSEKLTTPEPGTEHRYVHALPEGRGFLFTIFRGTPDASEIATLSSGGEIRTLFSGVTARYARSGHVVYTAGDGTLMAAPFDLSRLEATAPAVPLIEGVAFNAPNTASQFALSGAGTLIYMDAGGSGGLSRLVRVARNGAAEEIDPGWSAPLVSFSLSPSVDQTARPRGNTHEAHLRGERKPPPCVDARRALRDVQLEPRRGHTPPLGDEGRRGGSGHSISGFGY
jgi:hypothetical protein